MSEQTKPHGFVACGTGPFTDPHQGEGADLCHALVYRSGVPAPCGLPASDPIHASGVSKRFKVACSAGDIFREHWSDEKCEVCSVAKPEACCYHPSLPECGCECHRAPKVEAPAPAVTSEERTFDYCATCGGNLDTGWECNRCGLDWMQWAVASTAQVSALSARVEELEKVARTLDRLDWCIGYEMAGQDYDILDEALTLARRALAPKEASNGK